MSTVRGLKGSAFSCEVCRRRKVKCDGRQPRCSRCEARDETCTYRQMPTLAYTQQLESRIKDLETEVAALRNSASATLEPTGDMSTRGPSPGPTPTSALAPVPAPALTSASARTEKAPPDDEDALLVGDFHGLKMDDHGVTTYHGATSFFHLLDGSRTLSAGTSSPETSSFRDGTDSEGPSGSEKRQRLVLNAWHQRALENSTQIPEPFQNLLEIHWCWVQPLFNFIYRPAFTRDMAVLGPYYSHTLMNAVLSHSVRWARNDPAARAQLAPYDDGAVFGRHARETLFAELAQGVCTIPTVQTLLLLSAQECSLGHCAQAWVYSGMAFRLIDHLGICFDGQRRYAGSVQLSDEAMEIRRRLFWSCYFWDKIISLYLGRSPALRESLVSPPQHMLDDSAEEELWQPHGMSFPPGQEYPPTKAHSTSSFVQMCRLSVIFNQILVNLYDPLRQSTIAETRQCVTEQEAALKQWLAALPDFLLIEAGHLPPLSPPSHIVTLNCLYHTFRILMYRPMLAREPNLSHLFACVTSATAIVSIFDLFIRTFHSGPCVLSLNYSVYIAASIFLLQVQASINDQQALRYLEYCIRILRKARAVNPIIGTALDLITKATHDLGIDTSSLMLDDAATVPPGAPPTPAPAMGFMALGSVADTAFSAAAPPLTLDTTPIVDFPLDMTLPPFQLDNFDGLEISQEMFDAVSSLEPMPARVGVFDTYTM